MWCVSRKAVTWDRLAAVEAAVSTNLDRRFCVGSHMSVADVCLVPQLYNARRFDVDLTRFPRLLEVEAHLQTLPPFAAAHPDAQPDAVKAA
jgi:glutathione S-transferase